MRPKLRRESGFYIKPKADEKKAGDGTIIQSIFSNTEKKDDGTINRVEKRDGDGEEDPKDPYGVSVSLERTVLDLRAEYRIRADVTSKKIQILVAREADEVLIHDKGILNLKKKLIEDKKREIEPSRQASIEAENLLQRSKLGMQLASIRGDLKHRQEQLDLINKAQARSWFIATIPLFKGEIETRMNHILIISLYGR